MNRAQGLTGEDEFLREAYLLSMKKATDLGAETIAFPALGCSSFKFPNPLDAEMFFEALKAYAEGKRERYLKKVVMANDETEITDAFEKKYQELFGEEDEKAKKS